METRQYFLKQGSEKKPCGSFQLSLPFEKLRGKALFTLLRNALRRETHFRGMRVNQMALYDSNGRMVIPKQPEPKHWDTWIQNVKFIYPEFFPQKRINPKKS